MHLYGLSVIKSMPIKWILLGVAEEMIEKTKLE